MTDFKECKALAVVNDDGHLVYMELFVTRERARRELRNWGEKGERVIRVRIVRDN